jgi:hypothetical protein
MKAKVRIDKFGRRCIVLNEVSKVGGGYLVQVPKACEVMTRIINISKSIKADGPKRNLSGTSQYILRQRTQEVWAIIPTQYINQRYNFQQR